MTIDIGFLFAIAGCFVGLAGWLKGRDTKIAGDNEWKGSVNAKLDNILGIRTDVERLDSVVQKHDREIGEVKASASSAHKRIDTLEVQK